MSNINDNLPELPDTAEWIGAMIKLDKSNMTADEVFALEMTLAREGSMLAIEEAKIEKFRTMSEKEMQQEIRLLQEKRANIQEEIRFVREQRIKIQSQEKSAKNLLALKIMSDKQIALVLEIPLKKIKQLKKELENDNN